MTDVGSRSRSATAGILKVSSDNQTTTRPPNDRLRAKSRHSRRSVENPESGRRARSRLARSRLDCEAHA
jgi:hypothetical protein